MSEPTAPITIEYTHPLGDLNTWSKTSVQSDLVNSTIDELVDLGYVCKLETDVLTEQ